MDKPVIIFGAGGLGKLALEIFLSNGNLVYGFLDENPDLTGTEIVNVPVLGNHEAQEFLKLIGKKCEAFVAVNDPKLQQGLVEQLTTNRKVMPVNAIHQQAYLSTSSAIGHGNLLGAGVVLNAQAVIGNHNILHSQSLVDYEAVLGDFVQIGAGALVGSEVEIGNQVFVGSGAVIVSGIKIGAHARIGAGSVVVAEVAEGQTVFGNPAKSVDAA